MTTETQIPEGAELVNGVFHQTSRPIKSECIPALFLDRDGCVVIETHYLHKVEDVQLIDGAASVIARANSLNIAVVIVTNQAGIGYGYFSWDDFYQVQQEINLQLAKAGAHFDGVFACPFHVKGRPPYQHPNHPSRKPNPGMLNAAAASLNLDLRRSWIVGDRTSDIGAGLNANLAGGIHVASGHGSYEGEREASLAVATDKFQTIATDSIADIPKLIDLFT
jgi:D-glycero-D-manno-heptose 1,7-bisphosphate phosphatase